MYSLNSKNSTKASADLALEPNYTVRSRSILARNVVAVRSADQVNKGCYEKGGKGPEDQDVRSGCKECIQRVFRHPHNLFVWTCCEFFGMLDNKYTARHVEKVLLKGSI